jgi:hypothetical protein
MAMRIRNGLRALRKSLAVLAVASVLGTVGISGADEGNGRIGVVQSKNPATRALTLGDRVVTVTDRTKLTGLNGQRIEFADIPVFVPGGNNTMVEYEIEGADSALDSLRVIRMPR